MEIQKKQAKIKRLKLLYDLSNPVDLFTLIPQEMEIMEVKGMATGIDGATKKEDVLSTIISIAKENNVELDKELVSAFIDVINAASKGKYALNKVKR